VANRLGRPFFDSDTVGGLDLGHRVGDEDAELALAEYEWFERLSNSDTPAVIAAPSSLLDRPRTWRRDDMWIVWLAEPVEALVDRLDDRSVGRMVEAAERRRPVLEELADHRVDVDGRSPQEVAEEIAEMFERRATRT
jgi:shikimate kinase